MPFAPAGISALPGNKKSTVLWNPPPIQSDSTPGDNGSPVTGYRVYVYAGPSEDPIRTVEVAADSTMATIDGLDNGSSYGFRVRARNVAGDGALSARADSGNPAAVPFPPENSAATAAGSGQAAITWEPPSARADGTPGDNGSPINGYRVLVSPDCPDCTGTEVEAATYSTTVGGLPLGQEFSFTVVASNLFGESSPSAATNPVSFSAPEPSVPSVPTNIVAEWVGESQARVSWLASDANGSPVTGYTAVSSPGDLQVESSSTSVEFSGLDPTQAYNFRVRARNAVGESALSAPSDPISRASSPPAAPTSVIGPTRRGRASVDLQWQPSDPGNSPATGYTVQIYASTNNVESGQEPSSEFSLVHQGSMYVGVATQATVPTPTGKKYFFIVTASNSAGETDSLPTLKFGPSSVSEALGWAFEDTLGEFIAARAGGPREVDSAPPFPRYPYSFESDGCSVEDVRQQAGDAAGDLAEEYGAYFKPACQRHDFSYQNLGRRLHLVEQTEHVRFRIDNQFERDMNEICESRPDIDKCKTAANIFWLFVRGFAHDGFYQAETWTHRLNREPGMAACNYLRDIQCTG